MINQNNNENINNYSDSSFDTEDIFEANKNEIVDFEDNIFDQNLEEKSSITVQNGLIIDNRILTDSKYMSHENQDLSEGLSKSANSNMILDDRIVNDKKYDTFNFEGSSSERESKKSNLKKIFNSKKTSILLPVVAFIFVAVLGMYLFVNNTKAETVNLIKITENSKVGYINNDGTIVVRPKYISGTDFYKGYAIVKNNNNLYGVLDAKGALEEPFGNYYYIGLFGNRYIASKFTNDGLKQGLLNEKLNDITKFKYDSISYLKEGIYLFTRNETMGVLNSDGKEIYTFKVDEIDDKNINVEVSQTNASNVYAKVKVNDSSTIININSGKEVYSYTLDDINVLDNNVFYIKSKNDNNSTYLVIDEDKVKFRTTKYKRVRVDDYGSLIAIAIRDDARIDYINLKNNEIINENDNNSYFYNDGLVLEITHDFNNDKDIYNIISKDGKISSFIDYKPINNLFYNDIIRVSTSSNKFNYINKEGKVIANKDYEDANDFSSQGYAVVSNDQNYGVLDKKGKEIISLNYKKIDLLDDNLFNLMKDKYNISLFIYSNDNGKFGLLDSKNKIFVNAIYDGFEITNDEYPFLLAYYNNEKVLINLETGKELSIKIDNDITIKENYIICSGNYYNYNGKLIYMAK